MITSLQNKRVAKAVRLKKRALREKDRRFLVEGAQAVGEAIASGSTVHEVFHTFGPETRLLPVIGMARDRGIRLTEVSEAVMARLTSTVTPQGLVAVADFVDVALDDVPETARTIPILVEVRDPGNAGTIVRSADAADADAVVFTRSSVDIYNEKVVRATAGSLFHVPVVREASVGDTVSDLRGRGFAVLAADPSGAESLYDTDFSRPTALLFGNEAQGVPEDVLELADRTIRIPIAGRAESLNLAAATAVVMYEAARQRGAGPSLAGIVGGSAHDIRSPLAALIGFTSTMLGRWDRLDDGQKLAMLEGIAHDAARMRLLVAQLVDAARITSGSLELRLGPVDALEVAMQVRRDVAGPDGGVEVTGQPATVWADPDRLHTIVAGLVEAAQWWGQDGPVRIDVSGPRLRVWRQGGDLGEGQIRALFAPREPGTGGGSKVGLFVAKRLVDALGGSLEPEATNGAGFVVTLPTAEPEGSGSDSRGR
jgi:TrmH family RNA methyltransferase